MPDNVNPVSLVTGGAQGIGRAIAIELARQRHHVVINHVTGYKPTDETGAYEVIRTIEEHGGTAESVRADVAVREERETMVEGILERHGRIDLLVNNAGVAPKERKDILEAAEESFEHLLSTNLQGPYFLTQLAANKMISLKEQGVVPVPRIVFITSISAYTASPSRGEYCVSKAGLSMAAKLFATRLGDFQIPVIEIAPGIIETRMTSGVKAKYDKLIAEGLLLTKRWGQPEDVAQAVAAVAAGQFDYSTGECIEVGGGFGLLRL